jgi:NADH-quinone oxidoreductase subunit L
MHVAETANNGFFFLAPWLVFAPVIGLLTNIVLGAWFMKRPWGEKTVGAIASLASGVAFIRCC